MSGSLGRRAVPCLLQTALGARGCCPASSGAHERISQRQNCSGHLTYGLDIFQLPQPTANDSRLQLDISRRRVTPLGEIAFRNSMAAALVLASKWLEQSKNSGRSCGHKGSTATIIECWNPTANSGLWEREVHMPIPWTKDVDAAFDSARRETKPLLLDFNAAPM